MLIEVAETHPPGYGKKVATVIAKGGDKFEIWPEKLADLKAGAKYEVEVAERDYNGRTFRKITKATPVNGTANGRDHPGPLAHGAEVFSKHEHLSKPPAGEAEFVGRILAALILKGEVANNKRQLFDATVMLRALWGATFGGEQGNGERKQE